MTEKAHRLVFMVDKNKVWEILDGKTFQILLRAKIITPIHL